MTGTRPAARRLVLPVVAAALLVAPVSSALATSCATDPLATPAALTGGTYRSAFVSTQVDFFDHYDYALVGTVADISTGPRGGRATVTFDVVGVLGRDSAEPVVDVSQPDNGDLSGYPFEAGRAYFVPLQGRNATGLTNFSHLCDPIAEVADPEAEYARLSALAGDRGIDTASPAAPVDDKSVEGGYGGLLAWSAAGALAVVVAAGTTVAAARRRT